MGQRHGRTFFTTGLHVANYLLMGSFLMACFNYYISTRYYWKQRVAASVVHPINFCCMHIGLDVVILGRGAEQLMDLVVQFTHLPHSK